MKWKKSQILIEDRDEEALKRETNMDKMVVCVSSEKETGHLCCKCKTHVSVGSPAFANKEVKKICSKCFFKRYEKGKNKKDKIVITRETAARAAQEIQRRENIAAS